MILFIKFLIERFRYSYCGGTSKFYTKTPITWIVTDLAGITNFNSEFFLFICQIYSVFRFNFLFKRGRDWAYFKKWYAKVFI